jgi:hypothetical protein
MTQTPSEDPDAAKPTGSGERPPDEDVTDDPMIEEPPD